MWKDIEGFDGYQVSDDGRVRTHNKRGVATSEALKAQKLIWEMGGCGFTGNSMGEVACGPGNWCSIHYSYHRGKNMR